VTIPLLNKDKGDNDKGYVMLRVFVPVMDAISTGSGQQNVFMAIDWGTIKSGEATHSNDNAGNTSSSGVTQGGTDSEKAQSGSNTTVSDGKQLTEGKSVAKAGLSYKLISKSKKTVAVVGTTAKSKTIKIPNTVKIDGVTYKVTEVKAKAFKGNKIATKVVIGNNVTKIGASAFANMKKLSKVTIGKKVTTIGASAFANNKKLRSVVIGKSVKTIGKKAFYKAKALKKVTVKSTKLKKVGKNAFKGINKKARFKLAKKNKAKTRKLLKKGAVKTSMMK